MQPPFRFPEQFTLFQLWSEKRGSRAMPDRAALTAEELRPWLGSIHLLEVIDHGRDFRYLIYGTDVARYYDMEMTRKFVSDWPEPMRATAFLTYQRITRDACPYLVRQNETSPNRVFSNHRLVLPLSKDGKEVDHILTHLRMIPANEDEAGIYYHALRTDPTR
jgi:hypothetical protein